MKAILSISGKEYNFNIINNKYIEFESLYRDTGFYSLDYGLQSTAVWNNPLSKINGNTGTLSYRNYSIERLSKQNDFIDVFYLLLYEKIPNQIEKNIFEKNFFIDKNIESEIDNFLKNFSRDDDFISILLTSLNYIFRNKNKNDPFLIFNVLNLLILKIYYFIENIDTNFKNLNGNFFENILNNLLIKNSYKNKDLLEKLLILQAEHGMNLSTNNLRNAISGRATLLSSINVAINSLLGEIHGSANIKSFEMLKSIKNDDDFYKIIEKAKRKEEKIYGFGHRVYKTLDPRAKVIEKILLESNCNTTVFKNAIKFKNIIANDSYFQKLHPNVDFYSGILLDYIGFPKYMYNIIFIQSRIIGWLSHWNEMTTGNNYKIVRPVDFCKD